MYRLRSSLSWGCSQRDWSYWKVQKSNGCGAFSISSFLLNKQAIQPDIGINLPMLHRWMSFLCITDQSPSSSEFLSLLGQRIQNSCDSWSNSQYSSEFSWWHKYRMVSCVIWWWSGSMFSNPSCLILRFCSWWSIVQFQIKGILLWSRQ